MNKPKTASTEARRIVYEVLSGLLFIPLAIALAGLSLAVLALFSWPVSALLDVSLFRAMELTGKLLLFVGGLLWFGPRVKRSSGNRQQRAADPQPAEGR